MELNTKMKIFFFALALCIISTAVFAELIAAFEINHNSIVLKGSAFKKITELKVIIKILKQVIACFSLAALLIYFIHNISIYVKFKFYYISYVVLKVRINS